MADKTDKTVAEEPQAPAFPETWDELRADPLYETLPDLVPANEFTPSQSALFAVTDARLTERLEKLSKTGVFDADESRREKADAVQATLLLAEYVEYASGFYRELAKEKDAWDEWVKGRSVFDSYRVLLGLHRFYTDQLGKSSASKTRSANAA